MPTPATRDLIPVLRATGTGSTALSAFHDALVRIDAGHYNLLRLSSVIPPLTGVDPSGATPVPTGQWGDRMYCVYAEQRATTQGEEAWAGIGWVQRLDGGGGLFVEHEGTSEAYVHDAIVMSLRDLVAGRERDFSPPRWLLNGAVCVDLPICSLVLAGYETAPWARH